ncbi:MAG: M12 family metallo-peptidase, partial [Saprospiraceae bacterium]
MRWISYATIVILPFFFTTLTYAQILDLSEKWGARHEGVDADTIFDKFTITQVNLEALMTSMESIDHGGSTALTIKMPNQSWMTFLVSDARIATKDTKIYTQDADGRHLSTYAFAGIALSGQSMDQNSSIRLTINEGFIYGVIRSAKEEMYIEPLKYYNQWADNDEVIVYQAKDVKKASVQRTCFRPNTERSTSTLSPDARSAGDCYKAKLAILADYAMYIDPAHSGVAAVVNHIVGVMNNVGLDFQYNGGVNFGDGISFELSELVIATCATCDPLSAQTNPTTLLSEFSSWIDKGGFAHPFHAAHLWTDRDLISTTVGVAFLSSNLYCRTMARAIFQDWSTNALMLRITISHEIGHNFNAAHDASNSGYIMAPTISSTSTTWSPDSKSMISGQITLQGPSCLSACSAQPCSSLTGLSLGAVTPTNFSLSWNASSAGSYLVKVRELGSNIDLINTNTNAANITLSPLGYDICKKYDVFVYNNCSASGLSEVQRLLVISPVSQGCADFSASSQAGWVGKTMSLTDQSINASSWFWNFGNGQTSSQKNPTIAYTNAGTYHISLTVNGNHTMTKASYINILPDMPTPFTTTQGGDFESNLNYFASATMDGGPNIWELGSSTYSLATQGNAWKTKLNTNVPQVTTKSALYSPRFNFSGYQFHTLSFDLSMQSLYCNAPIAVQLQYSTDDGSSWQRLGNA